MNIFANTVVTRLQSLAAARCPPNSSTTTNAIASLGAPERATRNARGDVKHERALSDKMERSSNRCGMAPFSRFADSSYARGVPLQSNNQLAAAVRSIYQALPSR